MPSDLFCDFRIFMAMTATFAIGFDLVAGNLGEVREDVRSEQADPSCGNLFLTRRVRLVAGLKS